MKHTGILFLLLLFLAGCTEDKSAEADLFSAISKNSALVVDSRDLLSTLEEISQTRIYGDLDSLPGIAALSAELRLLYSAFPADSLRGFLEDKRVLFSLSPSGADKYDLFLCLDASNDLAKLAIQSFSEKFAASSKTYSESRIYTFREGEREVFSLSHWQGMLMLSPNITLVEEAIRQINASYTLRAEKDFNRLYETANRKDPANIYLQLTEAQEWLQKHFPQGDLSFLSRMGSWAEMDLQVYNQEMLLSGLILLPEEGAYYLSSFEKSDAMEAEGAKIIPATAGMWIAQSFENAEEFHRNYEAYLVKKGTYKRHEQLLKESGMAVGESLIPWVDNEMGIFYTGSQNSFVKNAYARARDEEEAATALKGISDSNFIEGHRGMLIQRLKGPNLLPRLWGRLYDGLEQPYYSIYEGYVIFSEDLGTLKGIINDQLSAKVLAEDADYQQFLANISGKAHLQIIANNPAFLDLALSLIDGNARKSLESQKARLQNFNRASLQINVKEGAAYCNFYLLNQPKVKEEVSREWSTLLESPAASSPQMVFNHQSKHYNILIQDSNHQLYLIDADGNILWKRQLSGPMLGPASQVDIFRNNKLQLALNTATHFYLIDLLGRDVENFPLKLPQMATAGAGIFNYDQARNYRFVIPAGEKLLNYDISGKAVKGWQFKKADSPIVSSPQLFTVNGKDVICFLSQAGSLYMIDRRGEERFKAVGDLTGLHPPLYIRKSEKLKESELLAANEEGDMVVISFNGVVDKLAINASQFLYFNQSYISSRDEEIEVKNDESPWSASMSGDISHPLKAMIFRREFYLGAYSEEAEEIALFDKGGNMIKGFPVYAQGPFDMGSLRQNGTINIITTTEDGMLICYRVR